MPRRNRARRERPRETKFPTTSTPIQAPPGWQAERYRGGEPDRDYVCPGCERVVPRRAEHIVAWRTESERHRHWHTGCWQTATREGLDRYRWL